MRGGRLSDTDGQGRATTHGGLGNVSNRDRGQSKLQRDSERSLHSVHGLGFPPSYYIKVRLYPQWPEHTLKSLFIWHSAHVAVPSKGKLTCAHL